MKICFIIALKIFNNIYILFFLDFRVIMATFNASEEYCYPIVQQINHGDCKLAKLPFFNWQCVSNDELNHWQDINLFITGNDKSDELDLCDVVLVHSKHEGDESVGHKLIWTAQITTYWDFLKPLKNNYNFGKILFLLQLNNNEVEIILVVKSLCFEHFQYPDDISNLKNKFIFCETIRNRLNRGMDSMKPIFQSLFTLNDDCCTI